MASTKSSSNNRWLKTTSTTLRRMGTVVMGERMGSLQQSLRLSSREWSLRSRFQQGEAFLFRRNSSSSSSNMMIILSSILGGSKRSILAIRLEPTRLFIARAPPVFIRVLAKVVLQQGSLRAWQRDSWKTPQRSQVCRSLIDSLLSSRIKMPLYL